MAGVSIDPIDTGPVSTAVIHTVIDIMLTSISRVSRFTVACNGIDLINTFSMFTWSFRIFAVVNINLAVISYKSDKAVTFIFVVAVYTYCAILAFNAITVVNINMAVFSFIS